MTLCLIFGNSEQVKVNEHASLTGFCFSNAQNQKGLQRDLRKSSFDKVLYSDELLQMTQTLSMILTGTISYNQHLRIQQAQWMYINPNNFTKKELADSSSRDLIMDFDTSSVPCSMTLQYHSATVFSDLISKKFQKASSKYFSLAHAYRIKSGSYSRMRVPYDATKLLAKVS